MNIGQPFNPYKVFIGAFIPNALMEYPDLPSSAKLIWARLAQYAGRNGECFPKQGTLAQEVGLTTRQTQRMLSQLEHTGFIRSIPATGAGKLQHQSNHYAFLWHEIFASPDTTSTSSPGTTSMSSPIEEVQREENQTKKEKAAPDVAAKEKKQKPLLPPPPELADLSLYAIDQKLIKRWPEAFARWKDKYPQLDVLDVVRDAHGWECDNPAKRKTDRVRFLGGWLRRKAADEPVVEPGPYGKGDA